MSHGLVEASGREYTNWSEMKSERTWYNVGIWAETPVVYEGQATPAKAGLWRIGEDGDSINLGLEIPQGSPSPAVTYFDDYELINPAGPSSDPVPDPIAVTLPFDTFASNASVPGSFVLMDVSMTDEEMEPTEKIKIELAMPGDGEPYTGTGDAVVDVVDTTVDLDIDSDNNGGLASPSRSTAEDAAEASSPGKFISVNYRDRDDDQIAGFADGYNWFGSSEPTIVDDDLSSGDTFTPVQTTFPKRPSGSSMIAYNYSFSDPLLVTTVYNPMLKIYEFAPPANGRLRLWTKPALTNRDGRSVTGGGDIIPSGALLTYANYLAYPRAAAR